MSPVLENRARHLNPFTGQVLAAILMLIPHHAQAWEFTPGLPCLLTHEENGIAFALTYDPGLPLYVITITHPERWTVNPGVKLVSFPERYWPVFGLGGALARVLSI